MPKGYAPKPLAVYPWHYEVEPLLRHKYEISGFSQPLYDNDWALLRRTCGALHPSEIGIKEMETTVLSAHKAAARFTYVGRFRCLWQTLRQLGVVPADQRPDDLLPKIRKPRNLPRPITKAQAEQLMNHPDQRFREWFTFACLAGLRAMEIATIEGSWLEETNEGYALRIVGKGSHELTVLAHPKVVAIIQAHRTFGPLYGLTAAYVSKVSNLELRRLGIPAPYTLHSLRHFFATYLLEASGGDLVLVADMMRHASLNTTRGYAALAQGRKRTVLDSLFAGGSEATSESVVVA